ncbi:hypothetical protein LOTGIDRAFT_163667 [Lottia gigantea]|uniref:G-protein coupled receptors family 1 profile domain-containing protein n=1 Tax=Lottia gigantea TaxID=225164 RepID=V4A6Z1_LOTGI|nr:hypothetical protein LOTGIDRAFT_163667 [Lottia gigantea]ESO90785.1 hypothetical protein LOTGIDRAFT_163667 [Lottia gigantea]
MDTDFIYPRQYVQSHLAFHIIYYALVPAISFFGNLFTFIIVCKISKYRKSVQDSLVGALALNDVLTAIIVMLPSLIAEIWGRYFGSKIFCEFSAVTVVWYIYTTFAIIVLISVERWIAISKPFLYKRMAITPTFMKGVVGCLGCFCLLLASIPLFIYPVTLKSGWYCSMVTFETTNITFNGTTTFEVTEIPVNEVLFIKIAFLTVGITLLLSCNISIAYQLTRKKSFDLRSNRLERKFAKLMWVVAICFLLTWLPNLFARFACAQGSGKCEIVKFYAMKVVMAGCAVNPLVYGVMKKTYRRGYIYLTRMTLHYSTFTLIPAPKYGEEIFDLREGIRVNAGSSSGTRASTSVSAA